ncbi:MAG: glycosyltransferase family 2 protein [Candidatus Hydrogenedentes bacterium]|nr:glycosyltransferase family 2 protein [Candidatus Hydrogenedentota bacterium]
MSRPLSLIVPIFNEEEILISRVETLLSAIEASYGPAEILLSENGSMDRTKTIARELAAKHPQVRALIDDGGACYGRALLEGMRAAAHDEAAILELDYLDLDFLDRGYEELARYDLVIGSKKLSPGIDRRPLSRRVFTELYNFLLRHACKVPLTETHGLKVFRISRLLPLAEVCQTKGAVWPSELCVRAALSPEISVKEIPLSLPLTEIRTTRLRPLSRLRRTLEDIAKLRSIVTGAS